MIYKASPGLYYGSGTLGNLEMKVITLSPSKWKNRGEAPRDKWSGASSSGLSHSSKVQSCGVMIGR